MSFPPPPWPMIGPVLIVPLAGRVLLLGDWREGAARRYGELATLVGPRWRRGRTYFHVTTMHVDHPDSKAGGRAIWGVPKELATFAWSDGGCAVRDEAGSLLARLRWPVPRVRVGLPASGFFAGDAVGPLRRARLGGTVRVGPVVADVDAPLLGVRGRRLALAGEARLRAEEPRVL